MSPSSDGSDERAPYVIKLRVRTSGPSHDPTYRVSYAIRDMAEEYLKNIDELFLIKVWINNWGLDSEQVFEFYQLVDRLSEILCDPRVSIVGNKACANLLVTRYHNTARLRTDSGCLYYNSCEDHTVYGVQTEGPVRSPRAIYVHLQVRKTYSDGTERNKFVLLKKTLYFLAGDANETDRNADLQWEIRWAYCVDPERVASFLNCSVPEPMLGSHLLEVYETQSVTGSKRRLLFQAPASADEFCDVCKVRRADLSKAVLPPCGDLGCIVASKLKGSGNLITYNTDAVAAILGVKMVVRIKYTRTGNLERRAARVARAAASLGVKSVQAFATKAEITLPQAFMLLAWSPTVSRSVASNLACFSPWAQPRGTFAIASPTPICAPLEAMLARMGDTTVQVGTWQPVKVSSKRGILHIANVDANRASSWAFVKDIFSSCTHVAGKLCETSSRS